MVWLLRQLFEVQWYQDCSSKGLYSCDLQIPTTGMLTRLALVSATLKYMELHTVCSGHLDCVSYERKGLACIPCRIRVTVESAV